MLDEDDPRAQQGLDGRSAHELAQIDDRNHCVTVSKDAGYIHGNMSKPVEADIGQNFDYLRNVEAISLASNFEEQRYHRTPYPTAANSPTRSCVTDDDEVGVFTL